MPANPAYLMALPTRIDPMLGYLTTGYHDHVKIRETFGYRINDAMQAFFQSLHVIDRDGKPTHHFGDPAWIYVCYCRKRGDLRSDDDLRHEAKEKIEQVRQRGVFISEGFGEEYSQLPRELATQVRDIYTDAKACIWAQLPDDFESRFDVPVSLETLSKDRNDYILHPTSGEDLSLESLKQISRIKAKHGERFDTAIVISDGLNALACTSDQQAETLASLLRRELTSQGYKVIPEALLIRAGRVRAGYRIGESLFGGRPENCQILHIIGERPGSGHRTLSVYITRAPGATWGIRSKVDHNITKVVSGIALTSLQPEQGATTAIRILKSLG
jgi:ethanolamine ammonia-lyase large subunit